MVRRRIEKGLPQDLVKTLQGWALGPRNILMLVVKTLPQARYILHLSLCNNPSYRLYRLDPTNRYMKLLKKCGRQSLLSSVSVLRVLELTKLLSESLSVVHWHSRRLWAWMLDSTDNQWTRVSCVVTFYKNFPPWKAITQGIFWAITKKSMLSPLSSP